jgi:phenylacetate-CoA ligase
MEILNLQLDYQLKAIYLISENFTLAEINKIRSFFKCEVSSFFGHSERLIFAPLVQKSANLEYKIDNRYGYFELLDNKRQTITTNGVIGELTGTSFDNMAMPLIRYRTNDFTSYSDYKNNKIDIIQGRWKGEFIVGKNDEELTLTALNMHSDILENINVFQFHQVEKGKVDILVVPKTSYRESDREKLYHAFNAKIGHALNLRVLEVQSPVLTSRGKLKKLIKEIK